MSIKLLVCDIDDTLIGDDNIVSKGIKKALKDIKDRGIILAMATGRMHISALPYVDMLDAHGPVISYNGALIIDTKTDTLMRECTIDIKNAKEVLEFAQELGVHVQYYSKDEYFIAKHCKESEMYHIGAGVKGIAVSKKLSKALDFNPMKILFICNDENVKEVYEKAKKKFSHKLEVLGSKKLYIEFTNKNANKGIAVKELAEHYVIDLKDVMAIGNGHNDISMIKAAGIGVAVGNSSKEVKMAADYVCETQENDGAVEAITRFLL